VRGAYFLLCRTFLFCGFFGLFSLLRLGAAAGFGALGAFFLFSSALLLFYGLALTLGLDFGGFFSLFGLFCLGAAAGFGALGAFFEFSSALLLLFCGLALALDLDFCGFFSLFGLFCSADLRDLVAADGLAAFGAFLWFFRWRLGSGWGRRLRGGGFGGRRGRF
jgi:hypothetical protein